MTSGTYPWSFVTQIFHNGQPMCNNASPFSLYSTIVVLFHYFRRLKPENDRSHGTDPIGMVSRM
jgi:hypothetical protein